MRSKTTAEWIDALEALKIGCGPINTLSQVFADPQVQARGMAQRVRHGSGSEIELVANPIRFSATPIGEYRAPPMLGEHTDEVLRDVLNLDAAARDALRREGVIG